MSSGKIRSLRHSNSDAAKAKAAEKRAAKSIQGSASKKSRNVVDSANVTPSLTDTPSQEDMEKHVKTLQEVSFLS